MNETINDVVQDNGDVVRTITRVVTVTLKAEKLQKLADEKKAIAEKAQADADEAKNLATTSKAKLNNVQPAEIIV